MKILTNIIIALVLVAGCFNSVEAQEERPITRDTRGWIGVSIQKEVLKDLDLQLEQSLRWKEDVSELYRNFTQVSLKYKVMNWASVKTGYRYAYGTKGYSRYFGSLSLKTKVNKWRFKTTSRFEATKEREEGEDNNTRWRQKGHIAYKRKNWKLKPFVFGELFFPIEENTFQSRNRIRYGLGTDFVVSKKQTLSLSCFFQDTSKKKSLQRQSIVSLDYQYEF